MLVDVYYNDEKILTTYGIYEAAKYVASKESIQNVYSVELCIEKCILLDEPFGGKYKFKLRGE